MKRWMPYHNQIQLVEGEVPMDKGGFRTVVPEQKKPPYEGYETENYVVLGKEEYWGYEYKCKRCGVRFMAYGNKANPVVNFCPGCGKKLQERLYG